MASSISKDILQRLFGTCHTIERSDEIDGQSSTIPAEDQNQRPE